MDEEKEVQFPETKSKIALPANCRSGEEQYFAMSLEGQVRACKILKLEKVFANRELVLWKNSQMLPEAFAHPWLREKLYGGFREKVIFRVKNTLRPTKKINELVLWCLDGYSTGGYFHWITEIIPRLWMARGYLPGAKFAIPDYFLTKWPFCADILSLLGVKEYLVIENDKKYLLEHLVLPTRAGDPFFLQPIPLRQGVDWLEKLALKRSSADYGDRIYISRAKANHRKVLNEEELQPVLHKYGFRIVYFEELTFSDQVSICKKAKVLLGLHGAGLSNLVFLPPQSQVIEIRPDKVYHMYNCFFTLSSHFPCAYNYILCEYAPVPLSTDKRLDDHSVLVSPAVLEEKLLSILYRDK